MTEAYGIYIFSFLLGCIGSIGYFLSLVLYGRLGRYKTKEGHIRKAKIFGLCITGGLLATLLQATIKENFAAAHALIIGAGWIVIIGPLRSAIYQLQQERKDYIKFMEASLIPPTKEVKILPIKHFIRKDIDKISPDTPISNFWPKLRDSASHLLIVEQHNSTGKVVGIIGKRDIIDFVLREKRVEGLRAREIMNSEFIWTQVDAPLDEVIAKMNQADLDRIVVLNRDREAMGWVTRKSLRYDSVEILRSFLNNK